MGVVIVPFRGRQVKMAGDRTFDAWTVTVINDTDFKIRNAMERWMNGMNAHSANTGLTNPTDYEADLIIEQLDKNGSTLKKYNMRGCFPSSVSPIELSYASENEIERFQVEFQVTYWESGTTS